MAGFFAGAGSALIGGALSGISNLFGAHSQNQSVEKQLAAAREEAEKTRKWQTSEREAQNDWNYKLWQANNEYNTPAAVQSRLKAAGINPDLYATNGALQGSSIQAQGGHTPSGPVADTSAWNRYKPVGSVASQALADTALAAQVSKTNAETEGQKHTNDILASDASFRDAFNQGQLDTMDSVILVNGSKVNLNDAQAAEARSMVEQVNASIRKIDSEIDLLISNAALLLRGGFPRSAPCGRLWTVPEQEEPPEPPYPATCPYRRCRRRSYSRLPSKGRRRPARSRGSGCSGWASFRFL